MKNDCCAPTLSKSDVLERPRYYPRQLITADDLTLEQNYQRDKLRRHNRMLHGWGVVCGAKLAFSNPEKPYKVMISSGYVLGPFGDEIWIERDLCFDLRMRCLPIDETEDPCDPCHDGLVQQPIAKDTTLHVAIRYQELKSRPVRVQPVGCGCDDNPCEYSRIRDGYELCVLDECPSSHTEQSPDVADLTRGELPDCPPPPTDPWVVLGTVTLGDEGKVTNIASCSCRRQVASFARFHWSCEEQGGD